YRYAVRFYPAIAATFANKLVDDDALVRVGKRSALAAATLFGRAGLIIDQDGNTFYLAQPALDLIQIFAVMNRSAFRELELALIFLRLIRNDGHMPDAFGAKLGSNLFDGQGSF